MRVAACQYHFSADETSQYPARLEKLVASAKEQHADLIVLPEYLGMQSVNAACTTDKDLFAFMQATFVNYLALLNLLAHRYGIYIQAGTTLVANDSDQYVNRAYLIAPDGTCGYQDKLQLTAYEKESGLIARGVSQTIFSTPFGKIGIAICYDSEFPEIVRTLVKAGATLILVPSYTTTMAGYHRVQISCRARAIENQCYVAMAAMHGDITIGHCETAVGAAGIYGPAEMQLTADGILAQGELNHHGLVVAELDINTLASIREQGDVHNYHDFFSCDDMLYEVTHINIS